MMSLVWPSSLPTLIPLLEVPVGLAGLGDLAGLAGQMDRAAVVSLDDVALLSVSVSLAWAHALESASTPITSDDEVKGPSAYSWEQIARCDCGCFAGPIAFACHRRLLT